MLLFLMMPMQTATAQTVVPVPNAGVYVAETSSNTHSPIDPATDYETLGGGFIQVIYEGLMRYNGNSLTEYAPALALNYTVDVTGTHYTFNIRQGVNFTDGSPFNAYVMQYSIQRAIVMNDPASGVWIPESVIRDGPRMLNTGDLNVTQANQFLANMSVHADSQYVLSVYLEQASSAFIPSMIFSASYAVSPSAVIANEPSSYTTTQSDDVFGMISLADMFPGMTAANIRTMLGLSPTADVANSGIVPESADGSPSGYNWDGTKMPGTGPYIMQTDTPGVETVLVKNNNWWNKANFNANAPDTVQLKQVSETSTRILDLKNGNAMSVYIPNSNLDEVMNVTTHVPTIDNINVFTFPSLTEGFLGFNQNATLASSQVLQNSWSTSNQYNASFIADNHVQQYSWNNATGDEQLAQPGNPFTSLLFRKAFAYAFDYDAYIKTVTNNQDFRMQGVIPKGLLGHQDDLIAKGYVPSQNLALAKTYFQAVSWQGYVTINYNSGSVGRQQAAQLLKDTIASLNVGITVLIQELSWPQFLQFNYGGQSAFFFLGWAPDYADASDYAIPFLHTGGTFPVSMRYSNPYVDQLMDDAVASTNQTFQNLQYRAMEINASQDFPMIYLNQVNNVVVRSKWVTGYDAPMAGNLNPMSYGTNYQYIGLEAYTKTSTTTTSTTQTTSSTSTTSQTSSSSSSSSSSSATSSSSSSGQSSPGFEAVAMFSMFTVVGAIVINRRRRN